MVYSLGAIFHIILLRANTGCYVYWKIHMSKRAIFEEFNFNIPFLEMIHCLVIQPTKL